MTTPEIAESFANTLKREHEHLAENRSRVLTRLVWFVAIDAYALLNARPYWVAIAGRPIEGSAILWLSLPWLLSATLGVATHFISDSLATNQDNYFNMMVAAVDLVRIQSAKAKPNEEAFQALVYETDPRFQKDKKTIARLDRTLRLLELLTFSLLVLGLVWSVVGPFVVA
jgi:hypothetical protein